MWVRRLKMFPTHGCDTHPLIKREQFISPIFSSYPPLPPSHLPAHKKSIYLIKMHKDLIINEASQEDDPFIKSSSKHPCYTVSHLRGIAAINNHGKINFKLYKLVYRVASCSWSPISSTTCQYYECPVALTALRNEQYRSILEVLVWSAGLPSANSLSSAAR